MCSSIVFAKVRSFSHSAMNIFMKAHPPKRSRYRSWSVLFVLTWLCMSSWIHAGEPETLRVYLHWIPQSQFAGYIMAKEKGFYKAEGLPPVTFKWMDDGSSPFEELVQGEVDFCTAWLADGMCNRAKGLPIVTIAQVFAKSSQMLVVRSDSGITTPSDMNGRKIGIWSGEHRVLLDNFLKSQHIEAIQIPQSDSLVPFLRGLVDICSVMWYNEYNRLIESGLTPEELRLFRLEDYQLGFPEDAIFCSEQMWKANPERCQKFVRASQRGWQYAFAHPEETVETVLRYSRGWSHSNANHQTWMLEAIRDQFPEDVNHWGELSQSTYERLGECLKETGVITEVPDFQAFCVGVCVPSSGQSSGVSDGQSSESSTATMDTTGRSTPSSDKIDKEDIR